MHEDYNCTLNQTNIERNNKFYIIQLLKDADCFFCWTRWGRVVSATQPSYAPSSPPLPAQCMPPAPKGPHSLRRQKGHSH